MSHAKPTFNRIAAFPKPYRDALAYWSTLRKLGFGADDIFFGFGEVSGQPDCVHLQLKTQGKEFTITVAQIPDAAPLSVFKTWERFSKVVNVSTEPERAACVKGHLLANLDYLATMVVTIQNKGIVVPQLPYMSEA